MTKWSFPAPGTDTNGTNSQNRPRRAPFPSTRAVSPRDNRPVVTRNALLQRLNRTLRPLGEKVKVTRGERWRNDLGDSHLLDTRNNLILARHLDPEALGREIGVLRIWERLEMWGGHPGIEDRAAQNWPLLA